MVPTRIVWHCTATPAGRNVTLEDVRRWHVEERGWRDVGYHFVIELDGRVRPGRPLDVQGAHVRGHNADSIGIAYVGGVDAEGQPKDTRTRAQRAALLDLTVRLCRQFDIAPADVVGHHDLDPGKACPSFDVSAERGQIAAALAGAGVPPWVWAFVATALRNRADNLAAPSASAEVRSVAAMCDEWASPPSDWRA